MRKSWISPIFLVTALFFSADAYAEDYVITIKNHQFSPPELIVPAGQKVKVTVINQDETPAEFESSDLNREKAVSGHSQIVIFIGPLDVGRYSYVDDFNHDTAKGTITAK